MNGVIGPADLARRNIAKGDIEGIDDYLGKIQKTSRYLTKIINDILDVAKIEENKLILLPRPGFYQESGTATGLRLIKAAVLLLLPAVSERRARENIELLRYVPCAVKTYRFGTGRFRPQ